MKQYLWLACLLLSLQPLAAQTFELAASGDTFKGLIGETIRVPLRITNISDKPLALTIHRLEFQIGSSQRNYLCLDLQCAQQRTEDALITVAPGQTSDDLLVALEGGLAPGISSVKYAVTNLNNPAESLELDLHFVVEESSETISIYSSPLITLHNLYPNPVSDHAFVNYSVHSEQVSAKITIHNILGNAISEFPLPFSENKVKIGAETLNAGIYFYTLYLDNEGVITRKLIVKK